MTSSVDIAHLLVALHSQGVPVTWACQGIGESYEWGRRHIRAAGLTLTRRTVGG